MKKLILLTLALTLFAFISLRSTVLTVSNNPDNPAQFSSLQAAIDSASVGDTIMVAGSSTSYGNASLNKKLHLIGKGYRSSEDSDFKFVSVILTLQCNTGSDSTIVEGFFIQSIYSYSSSNGVIFRNNYVSSYISLKGNNWHIYNNYIYGYVEINNYSNILFINNIMIASSQPLINSSNQSDVIIKNNIFCYQSSKTIQIFRNISNALISDNIFYNLRCNTGTTNCGYSNNLYYNEDHDDIIPYGDNYGADNILDEDPLFENIPETINSTTLFDCDFHLQTGSPAIGAGSDDDDIGLYSGTYPWPDNDDGTPNYTGEPELPIVRKLNIKNVIVGTDSQLKFTSEGERK
jgi:hypothetical protein